MLWAERFFMRLFFDKQDVTLQDYGLPIRWFPVEAGTAIPLFFVQPVCGFSCRVPCAAGQAGA